MRRSRSWSHGQPVAKLATDRRRVCVPLVVLGPQVEGFIAEACASTMQAAAPGVKQLAEAGDRKRRTAARWALEGRGHPLFDVSILVYRLAQLTRGSAFVFVSHLTSIAFHGRVALLSHDKLIERYWALGDEIADAQSAYTEAQRVSSRTGSTKSVADVALVLASRVEEMSALCREIERRRLNPWDAAGRPALAREGRPQLV